MEKYILSLITAQDQLPSRLDVSKAAARREGVRTDQQVQTRALLALGRGGDDDLVRVGAVGRELVAAPEIGGSDEEGADPKFAKQQWRAERERTDRPPYPEA